MQKTWATLLVCFAFFECMLCGSASAEEISVRLVHGKTGKPQAKIRVYIVLGDPKQQQVLDLTTDRDGVIRFDPRSVRSFQVRAIGEVPCGEQPVGAPNRDYAVDKILSSGVVTLNDCGRSSVEPIRGRLTYFVRPATWLELFHL